MHELHNPRLATSGLEGAGRDASRLVDIAVAGGDTAGFLASMSTRRAEFVKALARPTMEQIKFHAVRVARDPSYLDKVPTGFRMKVRQYADKLIGQRSDRSSER